MKLLGTALALVGFNAFAVDVQLTELSNPPNLITHQTTTLESATTAVTVTAPPTSTGFIFTHWEITPSPRADCDSGRCADSTIRALNPVDFTILEDVTATAHFVSATLDGDNDQIPDGYELNHFGDLMSLPADDDEGDFFSLADEFLRDHHPNLVDETIDGGVSRTRSPITTVILLPDNFFYFEQSDPSGLVDIQEIHEGGTIVFTTTFDGETSGLIFTHWDVNGTRREDSTGRALSRVMVQINSQTTATAHFVSPQEDSDSDGIPDWLEWQFFGSLSNNGSDDPDADGLDIDEEFLAGTSQVLKDTIQDGGVSRSRGPLIKVPTGPAFSILIASDPEGLFPTISDLVLPGATVSTQSLSGSISGFAFSYWRLNGTVQTDAAGIPLPKLNLTINENTTATAQFFAAGADTDADGLPDWFEQSLSADNSSAPTDDADMDGFTLEEEFLRGQSPLLVDSIRDGGVSRSRSALTTIDVRAFPLVREILVDGLPNFFFADSPGSAGSFSLPANSAPVLGDWDGDGDSDLFVTGQGSLLSIYENAGSPVIADLQSRPIAATALSGFVSAINNPVIAVGDWSNDGLDDWVIGGDTGTFQLVSSTGHFNAVQSPVLTPTLATGQAMAIPILVDINGDQNLDLLAIFADGSTQAFLHSGSGSSPFSTANTQANTLPLGVPSPISGSAGDINGDGLVDVIVSDINGNIHEFHRQDDNSFQLISKIYAGSSNGFANQLSATIADLDGDGDSDVIAGFAEGGLIYLRNQALNLAVEPPTKTLLSGEQLELNASNASTGITWSLLDNRSGATLTPGGLYTAGSLDGVVDVIQARQSDGVTGRAYANVISTADQTAVGKAIIVAAGRDLDDPAWPASNFLSQRAYTTLRHRGYSRDNIRFLSLDPNQDVDGNGLLDDIDLPTSFIQLKDSLTNWADNASTLVVYFVDHGTIRSDGSEALFRLNRTDRVNATQMNDWVSALQDRYNTDLTMILEFCYAGNFRERLSYTGDASRIIVSATDSNELTHFVSNGQVSFSESFFNGIFQGFDIQTSFLLGSEAIDSFQSPTLDDTKDGLSNSSDGVIAATTLIGADAIVGQDVPILEQLSPNQSLDGTSSALIWADNISSVYAIDRVWCTVLPPNAGFDPGSLVDSDGDGLVDLSPVVGVAEIDLEFNPTSGRHEANVDLFSEPGIHKLTCFARDVFGSVAFPKQTFVDQTSFVDKLLIVLGGDPSSPETDAIKRLVNLVYGTALQRGFTKENIRLLHPDLMADPDDDGLADTFSLPTMSELDTAITSWAGSDADRLSVFLIAATGTDVFEINASESIDGNGLDGILDTLQANETVVQLYLEFPGSGAFIDAGLLPPTDRERITLASSDSGQSNVLRSAFSNRYYSDDLLPRLGGGEALGRAHPKARSNTSQQSGSTQVPQLDVINTLEAIDPDGFGTGNEIDDTKVARNRYFGGGGITGEDLPLIGRIMGDVSLSTPASVSLFAESVQSAADIQDVSAWITPPDYDGVSVLTQLDLLLDPATQRWANDHAGFTQTGEYIATFVATDTDGNSSLPELASVVVGSSDLTVSFASATQTVVEMNGSIELTVLMNSPTPEAIDIPFRVSGNLIGGLDFEIEDSVAHFAAGSSVASITVTMIDNDLVDPGNRLVFTLESPPQGVSLGARQSMQLNIDDDETLAGIIFRNGFEIR